MVLAQFMLNYRTAGRYFQHTSGICEKGFCQEPPLCISIYSGRGSIWFPNGKYLRCFPKPVLVPRLLLSPFTCTCYASQNPDPSYPLLYQDSQTALVQGLSSPQLLIFLNLHPPPSSLNSLSNLE